MGVCERVKINEKCATPWFNLSKDKDNDARWYFEFWVFARTLNTVKMIEPLEILFVENRGIVETRIHDGMILWDFHYLKNWNLKGKQRKDKLQ